MSVTYGFYNSLNGDRHYNTTQISSLFDGIIVDGIFASIGSCFAVTVDSGLTVKVGTGKAWFKRTWTYNDAVLPVTLPAAEPFNNRRDAIVIEVDTSDEVRANSIKVIKGPTTSGSNPANPTLSKGPTKFQYPLCYVLRPGGSTEVRAEHLNSRIGTSDAPFVTGPLQTININELLGRWEGQLIQFVGDKQRWFDQFIVDSQEELDEFVASMSQLESEATNELTAYLTMVNDSRTAANNELISFKNSTATKTSEIQNGVNTFNTFTNVTTQNVTDKQKELNTHMDTVKTDSNNDYKAFQTYMESFKTTSSQTFNTWFNNLKVQLDANVAANLQNQIDTVNDNFVSVDQRFDMFEAQVDMDLEPIRNRLDNLETANATGNVVTTYSDTIDIPSDVTDTTTDLQLNGVFAKPLWENGTFENGYSGWSIQGIPSLNNGKLRVTYSASDNGVYISQRIKKPIAERKYYVRVKVTTGELTNPRSLRVTFFDGLKDHNALYITAPASNIQVERNILYSYVPEKNSMTNLTIMVRSDPMTNATVGDYIDIEHFHVYDVTEYEMSPLDVQKLDTMFDSYFEGVKEFGKVRLNNLIVDGTFKDASKHVTESISAKYLIVDANGMKVVSKNTHITPQLAKGLTKPVVTSKYYVRSRVLLPTSGRPVQLSISVWTNLSPVIKTINVEPQIDTYDIDGFFTYDVSNTNNQHFFINTNFTYSSIEAASDKYAHVKCLQTINLTEAGLEHASLEYLRSLTDDYFEGEKTFEGVELENVIKDGKNFKSLTNWVTPAKTSLSIVNEKLRITGLANSTVVHAVQILTKPLKKSTYFVMINLETKNVDNSTTLFSYVNYASTFFYIRNIVSPTSNTSYTLRGIVTLDPDLINSGLYFVVGHNYAESTYGLDRSIDVSSVSMIDVTPLENTLVAPSHYDILFAEYFEGKKTFGTAAFENLLVNGDFRNGMTGYYSSHPITIGSDGKLLVTSSGANKYIQVQKNLTFTQNVNGVETTPLVTDVDRLAYVAVKIQTAEDITGLTRIVTYLSNSEKSFQISSIDSGFKASTVYTLTGFLNIYKANTINSLVINQTYTDDASTVAKYFKLLSVSVVDITHLYNNYLNASQCDRMFAKYVKGSVNINGKTYTNLAPNGDFSDGQTGHITSGTTAVTSSGNDRILTFSGSSSDTNSLYNVTLPLEKKTYYLQYLVETGDISGCISLEVSGNVGAVVGRYYISNPKSNHKYLLGTTFEYDPTNPLHTTNSLRCVLVLRFNAATAALGKSVRIIHTQLYSISDVPSTITKETLDQMYEKYVSGANSSYGAGRVSCVDTFGNKYGELYFNAQKYLRQCGALADRIQASDNGYELVQFVDDRDDTIPMPLPTPIVRPIYSSGKLAVRSGCKLKYEPIISDAGVYMGIMEVSDPTFPIHRIEQVQVYRDGLFHTIDVSQVVLTADKKGFTVPMLEFGDIVFFTYFFAEDTGVGSLKDVTFYKQSQSITDDVTNKRYSFRTIMRDGHFGIEWTELA